MWYIRECAIDRKASFAEIGSHRNLQSLISSFLKESCLCNKRTWHLWTMYCARCLPSVKWRYALGCVPAVVSKVDDSDNVWRRYAVQCLVLATQAFFFFTLSCICVCLYFVGLLPIAQSTPSQVRGAWRTPVIVVSCSSVWSWTAGGVGGGGGDGARCCCGGSSALLSVSVAVLRFLLVALCFFLLVCKWYWNANREKYWC